MKQYEIIPIQDIGEHIAGNKCKCNPSMIEESGNIIWVHNSFDGREGLELAQKELGIVQSENRWATYIIES